MWCWPASGIIGVDIRVEWTGDRTQPVLEEDMATIEKALQIASSRCGSWPAWGAGGQDQYRAAMEGDGR